MRIQEYDFQLILSVGIAKQIKKRLGVSSAKGLSQKSWTVFAIVDSVDQMNKLERDFARNVEILLIYFQVANESFSQKCMATQANILRARSWFSRWANNAVSYIVSSEAISLMDDREVSLIVNLFH